MTKPEKAIGYFEQEFNCSQSVLTAFSQDFQIPENDLLRISCAFGGGMGRRQLTCGAVTGALMVLGLHFGRGTGDDVSKKGDTYEKTDAFMKAFEARNGSVNCRELLQGLSMRDPAGLQKIKDLNLFKTSCYKYVRDAVEITGEMLQVPAAPTAD